MVFGREVVHRNAFSEDLHPGLAAFSSLARETLSWLLIGSLSTKLKSGVVANRSYLINPTGSSAAFYDKIHMFGVQLGSGESYTESATYNSGKFS